MTEETKTSSLRIGLALNSIGMLVDDETLKKIDPYLTEIQKEVVKLVERE